MIDIEFIYEKEKSIIQAHLDNSFNEIINNYIKKTNLVSENINFSANGKNINKNEILGKIMNESEKRSKRIKILVTEIIKSNDIICPKCNEICKYEMNNYRIKLSNCKNNHITENIKLNEYVNKQNIAPSKINCDICKNITNNNELFICTECNINLCTLCKSKHDNKHIMLNHDKKNYICLKHNKTFIKFCEDCDKDICLSCLNEHHNHRVILYDNLTIEIKKSRKKIDKLKNVINKFKMNLEEIINKFRQIMNMMEIYYEINNNIINNFEKNGIRNSISLTNFNNINESIDKEIFNITSEYDFGYNLNKLLYVYNEMNDINTELELNYKPLEDNIDKVKIFDKNFINNNIHKCKIIYENAEYDLTEYFQDIKPNYNNQDEFIIKLKGINNITNMSFIFNKCYSLNTLPDISNWDTSNIINMNSIFAECESLISLPDISKWNTSNVIYMNAMFCECNSLVSLPDISKWNTSNVTNMDFMFYGCNSLLSLPDLSKWDTSNVINMSFMFDECSSLNSLPDLSKWNTSNVTNMDFMFYECSSLFSLPDITKWDTTNVINMSFMFDKCDEGLDIPLKFKK